MTGMASKIEEMVKKAGYDISKSKAKKDDGNNSLGVKRHGKGKWSKEALLHR